MLFSRRYIRILLLPVALFVFFVLWKLAPRAYTVRLHVPANTLHASPTPRRNAIVMAATRNDSVDWVAADLPDWEPVIYSVDADPSRQLHTPTNKGKEAMAYLTYLIDSYETLPNITVFLHAHRDGYPAAWHNDNEDYSNVLSVQYLQLPYVISKGFVNLRCNWVPGCPAEIHPYETSDPSRSAQNEYADVWRLFFGNEVQVPESVGTPCCGQFAVTREAIRRRARADYEKYRKWLMETKLDDEVSGRVFEYLWHIIFGREVVMCAEYETCLCRVYGRCEP